ncbi:DMT family transporter [Rhodococcus sp. P1Y]|uniref:DMT family transporter n=1 Tax=Rhodococcus sp. P1Y TaxID=1302308 RepID=UPI000EAE7A09|nr:DMT family transporter [Rhodococcus sp. P1Y]AYJ50554.1 hypothetical protein D8W71_22300 [Rhodococcus sp. P1Y]
MNHAALGLVGLAAVFHAVWNIAAKRFTGDAALFVWMYMTVSAALCLPVAWIFGDWTVSWALVVGPLVTAVLHIAYSITLQTGYARADLNVVYPVARGVGPLLTVVVAVAVLGERPGPLPLLGGLIILIGILVVTGFRRRGNGSVRTGVLFGTATGVTIAAYTLWDHYSVVTLNISPVTYFALAVSMQSLLLTPKTLGKGPQLREMLRTYWREISIIAVLSPAAYILVLVAMKTLPLSVVAPARESSIVVGSLLAWWLFHEANPVRRLAGSAVVLGGIVLIAVN